jgi:hypothetical protein
VCEQHAKNPRRRHSFSLNICCCRNLLRNACKQTNKRFSIRIYKDRICCTVRLRRGSCKSHRDLKLKFLLQSSSGATALSIGSIMLLVYNTVVIKLSRRVARSRVVHAA